jgi:hypothetical protein
LEWPLETVGDLEQPDWGTWFSLQVGRPVQLASGTADFGPKVWGQNRGLNIIKTSKLIHLLLIANDQGFKNWCCFVVTPLQLLSIKFVTVKYDPQV